ncbi:MAG: hypothetical protein WBO77_01965 [Microgenomates group bacterium]
MASLTERGIGLARRYPKSSLGATIFITAFGFTMVAGTINAIKGGIDVLGPTGEIAPEPLFPGVGLPDQNPSDNESGAKPGCKIVRDQETPAQLMARSGEQIYPGKEVIIEYTATGHGGGQEVFPAGNLDDLNKISQVIWAGDQFCPRNPVQINFDNKNTTAIESANEGCITVNANDTIWGIVFNGSAYDGIKDDIVVKRIGLGSDGTTTKNKMGELDIMRPDIKVGDLVCLP